MTRMLSGILRPKHPGQPRLALGVFGKHPGWNDHIDDIGLEPDAQILEAGCGPGGNVDLLSRHGRVTAFDMDPATVALCGREHDIVCALGRLPDDHPFHGTRRFDMVAALDVIEHVEDDAASVGSLASCLREGGWLLLTVPAFQWMFSAHDRFHHTPDGAQTQRPVGQRSGESGEPADEIGLDQQTVPPAHASLGGIPLFPQHHELGKIQRILMRRRVGTMVVAELAIVTLVHHALMLGRHDAFDMAVVPVDAVEERVERRAEIETATASVANLIDPQRIFRELSGIDRLNQT